MNNQYEHVRHEFAPVYDAHSRILILGSLPSVKSREQGFYYGYPQNRFWRVLAALYNEEVPTSIDEKKSFLLCNHIAIYDVIEECDIIGSSDSSIRNVLPADIGKILKEAPIEAIYANGGTAHGLYMKYIYPSTGREAFKLPSTSPANAAFSLEKLLGNWRIILSHES